MKKVKIWIEAIRLRTLPVSASGVLVAIAIAMWQGDFKWLPTVLCLVFAILAQIVSNLANEYYDFLRGSDKKGRVGPRRGVTEGDIKPTTMRNATIAFSAAACAVGCGLIPFGGWWLIPAGVVIMLFALAYSTGPYPLSYHGLGEITVFVFYGIVPVNLTYYVMGGYFNMFNMLASIAIGFMGVNVLLVNNYRDADDDAEAGKHTSVVIFGRVAAAAAYFINGFAAMAFMAAFWLRICFEGKWFVLLAPCLYLILHTANWIRLRSTTGSALNALLGATARAMLIFTILLFITLLF